MDYTYINVKKVNKKFKKLEKPYDMKLKEDTYYIIRFDGVSMTTRFLKQNPRKDLFYKVMAEAIQMFVSTDSMNMVLVYSATDEVSVLISDKYLKEQNYRLEKVVSILTSRLTYAFCMAVQKNNFITNNRIYTFDGRMIELNGKDEILEYFVSRQAFTICRILEILNKKNYGEADFTDSALLIEKLNKDNAFSGISDHERYGLLWGKGEKISIFEFDRDRDKLKSIINSLDLIEINKNHKETEKRKRKVKVK